MQRRTTERRFALVLRLLKGEMPVAEAARRHVLTVAAVVDCHDHEFTGHEFARRGRGREAERALEAACLRRFGTLRPAGKTPVVR